MKHLIMVRLVIFLCLPLLIAACQPNETQSAGSLNNWQVSCGADPGSVRRVGGAWEFRTSSNHCPGGTFNQRAEINTGNFPTNRAGSFLFRSNVSISTPTSREFSIFSIHDGRDGCAPPLQLFVQPNGRMYVATAVKTGAGESCVDGRLGRVSPNIIRRDGSEQELEVLVNFDGNGGFDVTIMLDGKVQISGSYAAPESSNAIVSERFYFKHGLYSRTVFDYVMISRGVNVSRLASNSI